ncbi:hypothetical protein ABZZ79_36120 [Streptomyces sp. NPDC006458]|uniref:hypothetical protein n=1 Tax=Streptomyces sp. NPDC006458 TaxID=3154302 RepID=UPI0033A4FA68
MNSSPARSHRYTTAGLLAFALTCFAAGMLVLVLTTGLAHAWWPATGAAFTPTDRPARSDACGLVVGEAGKACQRHAAAPAAPGGDSLSGDTAWPLVLPAVGLIVLAAVRCRVPARRRRR